VNNAVLLTSGDAQTMPLEGRIVLERETLLLRQRQQADFAACGY
jgi:hypothetical protein